jgi:hypothetical protein
VKVIAPFTVNAPGMWITKTALELLWPSKVRWVPVIVEMSPDDAYTVFPKKVWLVAVVNDPVDVKPSAMLNAPPGLKMSPYAAVTAVSCPAVQGAALVGVQMKPVAVPFDAPKPVIVLVAPTLPVIAEVPVFETLPPRSPKVLAVPRFT